MYKKLIIFLFIYSFIIFTFLPCQTVVAAVEDRPDLKVTNFWIWPKDPTSREYFDISVRVRNLGKSATVNNTVVHMYIGGSMTPHSLILPPLKVSGKITLKKKILIATPGKYLARSVADPENKINEIDENNNTKQFTFRIREADNKEFLPDLYVYTPSFKSKNICNNSPIEFRVSVKNIGAVTSPPSKTFFLIGGVAQATFEFPPIDPGKTNTEIYTKFLQSAGNYTATAYADFGNKIKEYDEGNNEKSKNFTVLANCIPDLVLSNFWIWPKEPKRGEEFTISVRIYNIGNKTTVGNRQVHVFVGGSATPYTFNFGPLEPGRKLEFRKKLTFNTPGKYLARAIVDPFNKVPESDENNNKKQFNFRVN